jgi:hypothetical protein
MIMRRLLGVWLIVIMVGLLVGNAIAVTQLDATKPKNSDLISTFAPVERETRAKVNEMLALVGPATTFGHILYVSDYTDLTAAIPTITDNSTLVIDVPTTISANTTIPSTLGILIPHGGRISGSFTLTINGSFWAVTDYIFRGPTVTFGTGIVKEIYPEWWGSVNDGVSDDSVAVQAAIDACPDAGGHVKLSEKDWLFNADVNKTYITIEGSWVGNHNMVYDAQALNAWRPYTKTEPVLHIYSDRSGAVPYYTSTIVKNFLILGSNHDTSLWKLTDRGQKGIWIDQGSNGIYLDHFQIQGMTDYGVFVGSSEAVWTHHVSAVFLNNFLIAPYSGGYKATGLGDGVRTEYGDAPLTAYNWATDINLSNGMLWQIFSAPYYWDNSTAYHNDSSLGTDVVFENTDEPSDNGTWGYVHVCTVAGTSQSGGPPTWNHTVGGTTSDGNATWTTYQRGRLLNLIGAPVSLTNVSVESSMNYGGIRLRKDSKPFAATVSLVNSNVSSEVGSGIVIVENEQNSYPPNYVMKGSIPFWGGSYKPYNKPKYDPGYNFAAQTYTLNLFDSLYTWRPTILDGLRIQNYTTGFTSLGNPKTDIYKNTTTHQTMFDAEDNITLHTTGTITLDADAVVLPETDYTLNKSLAIGTFDGNTTTQSQTIAISSSVGALSLTNINLDEGDNMIVSWGDTGTAYGTLTSSGGDITSAICSDTLCETISGFYSTTKNKNYKLVLTLTLNSGEQPYLYLIAGDAATPETLYNVRPSNGVNIYSFTSTATGVAGYTYLKNLGASNWSATFTLYEHKEGIEKIIVAGDTNITVVHDPAKIYLRDGIDVKLATIGDYIGLLSTGGIWKEAYRSVKDDNITHTGTKLGFFGVTPTTKAAEIPDENATITYTAPSSHDSAIQDLGNSSTETVFGFKTKDEGNSVLATIANLQRRVKALEDLLVAYGLLTDAD